MALLFLSIASICTAQKKTKINIDFSSDNWKVLCTAEVKENDSHLITSIPKGIEIINKKE